MRRPFYFAHTHKSPPARAPRIRDAVHLQRQDPVPCSGDSEPTASDPRRCSVLARLAHAVPSWPPCSPLKPQNSFFPILLFVVLLLSCSLALHARSLLSFILLPTSAP